MTEAPEIAIRVVCRNLPGSHSAAYRATRLGIQRGHEVFDDVAGDVAEAVFTATLRVAKNERTGTPNFLGPDAHGTPQQRFLYLSWGRREGSAWEMTGRVKIQLNVLTWVNIESTVKSGEPLEVEIDMTGTKGGPICGSVGRDNIEWKV